MLKHISGVLLVSALATSGLGMAQGLAVAATDGQVGPSASTASFNGRLLDLRDGWGEARSCVAIDRTTTQCFTSNIEADDYLVAEGLVSGPDLGAAREGQSASALPACASGWLCLYEHINGGGRRLIFRDESWQHLSQYDFIKKVSTWRNNQCCGDAGHLRGSAYNPVITLSAGATSTSLGPYNDWAWDVHG
jgi:hypothetical protein